MTPGEETYITYKSRRQRGVESLFHSELEEEEDTGDINEQHKGNTMNILKDLARGQQQLVELLT